MISVGFIKQNFPKGKLSIIGGRPAMGKSSLAISMALSLAQDGMNSIYFSLEMSEEQLIRRMKMQIGEENYKRIDGTILIDDTPCHELSDMCKQMELLSADYVFVDYIHLVKGDNAKSREGELAEIIATLRKCAEKYGIAIIAFSQLTREWPRGFPKPQNWGARPTLESFGAIQRLDLEGVKQYLIHRPQYYNRSLDEKTEHIMEFLSYKSGECHVSTLYFNKESTRVSD